MSEHWTDRSELQADGMRILRTDLYTDRSERPTQVDIRFSGSELYTDRFELQTDSLACRFEF